MIPYKIIKNNRVSIHKNLLINGNNITAYYVVFPYNYGVLDLPSAERHISKLYNAFSNLYSSFGEVKMSMFKLKNIISKEETIDSITKTIKMYSKTYESFPKEYERFIKNIQRNFTILAIDIDVKHNYDIETQNLKTVIKSLFDNFIQTNFSASQLDIDLDALTMQNKRIQNSLQRYAVPANEKLVMNIFVNSVFPSYNLVYNDYMIDHNSTILSNIKQEIIPHLGWFEMTNSGISDFGATPRTTYGAMMTILEFPESIYSENFNIFCPGLKVNMNLLPKDKATLRFKRMRADVNQEMEEAVVANTSDSDIDEVYDLVQYALESIRKGRIVTEVDANILVTADTKEELDRKKKYIMSIMSDAGIVCSIAENQGKTFVNSMIKNRPALNAYYHIMDLQYALSFQVDGGTYVGDQDSKFAAPVIGISD